MASEDGSGRKGSTNGGNSGNGGEDSDRTPPEGTPARTPGGPRRNHRSDIGRRVALRREHLGLSQGDVADRAGIATAYLRYLEEHPASPSMGSLTRVARALETTVAELSGADLPAGPGQAGYRAELVELGTDDCRARLARHGVGRIGVCTSEGPAVYPVNYSVVDDTVVYRTSPESGLTPADGERTALEVDHIDEALSKGWSVLVTGRARHVTDPAEARHLSEQAFTGPWDGGEHLLWVRLDRLRITGRQIRAD